MYIKNFFKNLRAILVFVLTLFGFKSLADKFPIEHSNNNEFFTEDIKLISENETNSAWILKKKNYIKHWKLAISIGKKWVFKP